MYFKLWMVTMMRKKFYFYPRVRFFFNSTYKQKSCRNNIINNLGSMHLTMIEKLKALQHFYKYSIVILDVKVTLNNIYLTVRAASGKVLFVGSGGLLKLKNSKRNTTYVLQLLLISVLKKLQKKKTGIVVLQVYNLKKKYRKILLKYLQLYRVRLLFISTNFQRSYNGVRLKKQRRI